MLSDKFNPLFSTEELIQHSKKLCEKYRIDYQQFKSHTIDNKAVAIINTANEPWYVIEPRRVRNIFRKYRVDEYYYSPKSYKLNQTRDGIAEFQSVAQLLVKLQENKPCIIYLRVSPHTRSEFLVAILWFLFPEIKLVVEFYDVGLLFHGSVLRNTTSGDLELLEEGRLGCEIAFKFSNALITKNGGYSWKKWLETAQAKAFIYFPNIDGEKNTITAEAIARETNELHILYAGAVNTVEYNAAYGDAPGANLRSYFDEILKNASWQLDVVNAAHFPGTDRERYQMVQDDMSQKNGNANYHQAMPHEELLQFAQRFDLGLCCSHYEQDQVMDTTRVVVPNRVSSYWASGLPVIIDSRFEYICGLVSEYNAGIIIEAGNFAQLTEKLNSVNIAKLKAGVQNLVRSLLVSNAKVESDLQDILGI